MLLDFNSIKCFSQVTNNDDFVKSLAELGQAFARFSVYLELFDLSRLMDDFLRVYQIIANRSLLSLRHMKKCLLK
jgi:hypothetical protein